MKIAHLILFVTARCDSKCIMCFNYSLNAPEVDELTADEYKEIAENSKSRLKSIMISGGEPSLRKDLPEICQIFYDRCNIKKIFLPLNGHDEKRCVEVVEKILKFCPTVKLNVGLSIDGIGEIHDIQRGVKDAFNKVMSTHEALFGLSKANPRMKRGVITTVTKINVGQLEELVNYIYNLKSQPDYHDIMACRIQAGYKTDRRLLIGSDEYKKVLNIADKHVYYYCKKRYDGFIPGTLGYIRHKLLNRVYLNAYTGKRTILCKAPKFIRVIEADGRVRICEFDEKTWNLRDYNYDLNEMDRVLGLSAKKVECSCTHPCFVVPSFGYASNIIRYCNSLFFDKLSFSEVWQ